MATLASVHIKSDLEKRLECSGQDEATMIGVQQMRDGDFMTLEEWETRMENHLRNLKAQPV